MQNKMTINDKVKIMWLDDSKWYIIPRVDSLRRKGIETITAHNFRDGVSKLAENEQFDFYIVDGEFPERVHDERVEYMAGRFIDEIRQHHANAIIIVYSGNPDLKSEVEKKGVKFIFKGSKPITTVLTELLDLRAYPQRLIELSTIEDELNEVYPSRIGSKSEEISR